MNFLLESISFEDERKFLVDMKKAAVFLVSVEKFWKFLGVS